jgi:hypothetical protein
MYGQKETIEHELFGVTNGQRAQFDPNFLSNCIGEREANGTPMRVHNTAYVRQYCIFNLRLVVSMMYILH